MAQEIYYTSAPEGLRPGEHGFCTVAASAGMPRRLWDRLEALSGYRHQFDAGARSGVNPVCHAHWILSVDGCEHHVLSRICDAGLDYSQRTNALAHHLVLETSELAAGGPAWLLTQRGVMTHRWDGRVGEIVRTDPLPGGDCSAASCLRWQLHSGDAGWAGVVAQTISTSPWKPICLLFNPTQEVLPLVTEVIALLPPHQRWQATFNTYFTSLPGGVACQWRCCLAGTPAAATALRVAASGLVIDLSRPGVMGSPPEGPWVAAARSGQAMQLPRPGAAKVVATKPKRFGLPTRAAPQEVSLAAPAEVPPTSPAATPQVASPLPATPATQEAQTAPLQPDISWGAEMKKIRRRKLLAIYAIACLAIVAGVWLQVWASRASSDAPVAAPHAPSLPSPALPSEKPTVESPAPVEKPVVQLPPGEAAPVIVTPPPASVPVIAPVPPPPPAPILLATPLPPVGAGGGLRNVTRTLAVPANQFDNLAGVVSLTLGFPDKQRYFRFQAGDLDGNFAVTADGTQERPSLILEWLDGSGAGKSSPLVWVSLNRAKPQLEFTWNTSVMLRRPQLVSLAYWVLQNSTVVVNDITGSRPQPIEFSPHTFKPTSLLEPRFDPSWPTDLPGTEQLRLGKVTPPGWRGIPLAEPATAGKPVVHALRLEKSLSVSGGKAAFTVRFSAVGRLIESDMKQAAAVATDVAAPAETQIKEAELEIHQVREAIEPETRELEQRLADWKQSQARNAVNPQAEDLTPQQYQEQIDVVSKAIQFRKSELAKALAPLTAKRQEAISRREVCREQLAAYADLKDMELIIDLAPGLRVGSVRLMRE